MDNTTIEWLKANGYEKCEHHSSKKNLERYAKVDRLSRGLEVMTNIEETSDTDRIIHRTEHPYVVEMILYTPVITDCKLKCQIFFNGELEVLKKALKACEKGFWDKVAKYGKVLMVAGALHDGYKWINK